MEVVEFVKERLKKEMEEGAVKFVELEKRLNGNFVKIGVGMNFYGEIELVKKLSEIERQVMQAFRGKIVGVVRVYV